MRSACSLEVDHVVRRGPGAEDGGIHVLDGHELVLVEHMRGPRDVARDEDVVGHHAVDVECAATGIAGHPQNPVASSAPSSHSMCGSSPATQPPRPRRAGPVGQLGLPDMPVGVTFQRFDRHPGTQVDSGVALHLGGDIADHPAQRAHQRRTRSFRDRHVQPEITTDGGHFGADEPCPDDQHPLRPGLQSGLQLGSVVAGAQREKALQLGLFRVEPLPGPDAGGDQQLS